MKYHNFILTVIAILLALHLSIRMFNVKQIEAGSEIQKVDIVKIAGRGLYDKILDVRVKK